jgi:hypothetical protein
LEFEVTDLTTTCTAICRAEIKTDLGDGHNIVLLPDGRTVAVDLERSKLIGAELLCAEVRHGSGRYFEFYRLVLEPAAMLARVPSCSMGAR